MSCKLLYIITGLSTGGAEIMLLKLLENIDRKCFFPHVISLTTEDDVGERIKALGIPVESLGMTPGRFSPDKFVGLVRRVRALRPDVVHTWMYHSDLIGGLAARLAGVASVGWGVRHSNLSKMHNKASTLYVVRACAVLSRIIPKKIVCCSNEAAVTHANAGYREDKLVVIPNGFDLFRFVPDKSARISVRKELGQRSDTPLVGLIARYDPQKNHAGFFEAAKKIHQDRPDVHFILAGSHVDSSNLSLLSLIRTAGVGSVTHLMGRRNDIPRLMAALDVLASSSSGESFPNVLGEGMACSVTCVVTNVGDSAEIVGDAGRVVEPGDMRNLATQILEVLSLTDSERSVLGERARLRVSDKYDIGRVVKEYELFYESLLN